MNYKLLYKAYCEEYEKGNFNIFAMCSYEHMILHWARMNTCTKLDLDYWKVDCEFDLVNLLYTYHIKSNESHNYPQTYPCKIKFIEEDENHTKIIFSYIIG